MIDSTHNPRHRIVQALRLLLARGRLSTVHLARALGVSKKTALADLAVLESEAFICTVGEGREKEWMIDPSALDGRGTLFDALALRIGAEYCEFLRDTALHTTLDRAARATDAALRPYRERLDVKVVCVHEPARHYEAHRETLDDVLDGLLRERILVCTYAGRGASIEPLTLVIYRRALYLLARDVEDRIVRRLAVERLTDVTVGDRFPYPADWDPRAELGDWFGIYAGGPLGDVVLRFDATRADLVRSRIWHHTARVEALSDGRIELRLHSGGPELVRFVLEWGPVCEVVEPPWLREAVVQQLEAALSRYAASPVGG